MTRRVMLASVALLALSLAAVAQEQQATPKPEGKQNVTIPYRISGPHTQGNLSVFLLHGPDTIEGKNFLTLGEALEQKKVIVHETKNVNELAIENVSPDVEVFIQAGDIVKGGQQDRAIAFDIIVPPKSGKLPINSFCVEAGRWTRRGNEAADNFEASTKNASTKDLKLAVNYRRSQEQVWKQVAETQKKVMANTGAQVQAAESPTSLQLSLENKKVLETADKYVKELLKAAEGQKDVVGYAYAINGEVVSADVYASNALFKKLWPKLLEANAIEAIAEMKKDKKFEPPTADSLKAFMADAESGKKADQKEVTKRISCSLLESKKNVLVETRDKQQKDAVIHRSYVAK